MRPGGRFAGKSLIVNRFKLQIFDSFFKGAPLVGQPLHILNSLVASTCLLVGMLKLNLCFTLWTRQKHRFCLPT